MAARAFFWTLVLALYPLSSCATTPSASQAESTQPACTFEREISAGEIGPFRIGDSLESLRKNFSITPIRLPYSDEMGYQVATCDPEAAVIISTAETGSIESISTTSKLFQTTQGAVVGMSIEQLQRLHPEGIISTGVEEGGWIAFRLDRLSGFFEFSLIDVEYSCLRNRETCTEDFFTRPSIRYWARLK